MVQEIAKRAYFSRSAKMANIGSSRDFETASKQYDLCHHTSAETDIGR